MNTDNRARIDALYNYFIPWNQAWGPQPTLAHKPAPTAPITPATHHRNKSASSYGGESSPVDQGSNSTIDLYH